MTDNGAERSLFQDLWPSWLQKRPFLLHALCLWLPIGMLFIVAATGVEQWTALLEHFIDRFGADFPAAWQAKIARDGVEEFVDSARESFLLPLRAQLCLAALILLGYPLIRSGLQWRGEQRQDAQRHKLWKPAALIFLGLLALAATIKANQMGEQYAMLSANPFDQETGYYYRRLLVPALAAFLHLNGFIVYNIFSLGLSLLLIALSLQWFLSRGIRLSVLEALSLFSTGMLMTAFQSPGYVEQFVLILFLLSLLLPLQWQSRVALAALMLATHEVAAAVLLLPAVLLVYPRREMPWFAALALLYLGFWLLNFGFDFQTAVAAQTQISGTSAPALFAQWPERAALGMIAAHKALWLVWLAAIPVMLRRRAFADAGFIVLLALLPAALLPFGVDSSRLAGFGAFAMYMAVATCKTEYPSGSILKVLFVINLVIPSLMVTLSKGAALPRGLYDLLYGWLASL